MERQSSGSIDDFRAVVWSYYAKSARTMPWRQDTQPYYVLVSEMMLQQTQVARVIPKFNEFMRAFQSIDTLAAAPLSEVVIMWSGLGYNRRAKYLHEAAQQIVDRYQGVFPDSIESLDALPGVGYNTAAAIMAYAYDSPVVFMETNIRTVLLHHFFPSQSKVSDSELLEVAAQVLETDTPRQWYWALMDYGSYIKATHGGRLDQSAHYKRQSPLAGSNREMRGRIIRELSNRASMSDQELRSAVAADERYDISLQALIGEGLVTTDKGELHLTGARAVPIIGVHQ